MRTDRLRFAALLTTAAGLAIALYLTLVHYEGGDPVCGLGGDCEKVQTSTYAELAGVPVALLGLLTYVGVLLALLLPGEAARLATVGLAWVGAGFSGYLTYRELFTIDAICPWCVASAVCMVTLALLSTWRWLYPT